jgi:Carboxypeptidase regulatory-like domain
MTVRSRRIGLAALCAVVIAAAGTAVWADWERLRGGREGSKADRSNVGQGATSVTRDKVRGVDDNRPRGSGDAKLTNADCVLMVLNDLGAPLPDAHVALFRDERIVATGRTDPEGTVELAGSTEPCSLAVFPMGAGVSVQRLAAADGHVTVRLPEGAVVSGRVEIEGAGSSPIRVYLRQEDLSKLPAIWPSSVDRWIRGTIGHQPWLISCASDPRGSFRFAGLPPGTPLILTASQPPFFFDAPEPQGVRIEAPRSDVILACRLRPWVTGRVIAFGTRRAVPGAGVLARFSFQTGPAQLACVQANESGVFWLWIPKPLEGDVPTGATVWVSTAGHSGMRVFDFSPGCFTAGQSLGDLELGATRLVPYRVTDPAGDPIAGALVRATDRDQAIESVADGDGKGTIEVPLAQIDLTVGALGFRPTTVPAAEGPAEEIRIVLEAACLLRIQVLERPETGGLSTDSVVIEVQSDQPVLEGAPETWLSWERRSGMLVGQGWSVEPSDEHGRTFTFRGADITLSTVRPNVPVHVTVHDTLSGARTAQAVVLAIGERKSIELRLEGKPRTVEGRVTAANGTPVYWGLVHLMPMSRREEDRISRDTARDGSFAFENVLADRALVAVEGTSWIREVSIPAEGLRLEVRLEDEQEATVRVLDHENRPVGGVEVSMSLGAFVGRDWSDDEGMVRIGPVPSGEAIVEARHGKVSTGATARIPGPATTLVLPPYGGVAFESEKLAIHRIRLESLSCADVVDLGEEATGMSGIVPGRYRARIECWTDDEMRDPISLEREVTVVQGETALVKVDK